MYRIYILFNMNITSIKTSLLNLIYFVTLGPLHFFLSILSKTFYRAKTTGEKLILALIVSVSVLWISILSYTAFYSFYVPIAEVSRPIHLDFSVCSDGAGICSFPSSNVSLTDSSPFTVEVLGSGQIYNVVLDLEVPDTPVNRNLGMFMVKLNLFDRSGFVSAVSKRNALFKYKSLPVRMINAAIWSPLYFLGFYEERQILSVEMFSSHVDDFYHPTVGAIVEIQNHHVQIYSCQLNFYANFTGLRYFLYYWPITSAVYGITLNVCVYSVLLLIAVFNRRQLFREIANTLNQQQDGNRQTSSDGGSTTSDSSSKLRVTAHKSTQTQTRVMKGCDYDDLDSDGDAKRFKPPSVQEPKEDLGDILADRDDDELIAELRRRRVH